MSLNRNEGAFPPESAGTGGLQWPCTGARSPSQPFPGHPTHPRGQPKPPAPHSSFWGASPSRNAPLPRLQHRLMLSLLGRAPPGAVPQSVPGWGHLPRQQPKPWGALGSPKPAVPVPKARCAPGAGGFVLPLAGRDRQPRSSRGHGDLQRNPQQGSFCSFHLAQHHPAGTGDGGQVGGCKRLLDAAPRMAPDPRGTLPATVPGRCGATSSSCDPVPHASTPHQPWGAGTCVTPRFPEPQRAVTSADAQPRSAFRREQQHKCSLPCLQTPGTRGQATASRDRSGDSVAGCRRPRLTQSALQPQFHLSNEIHLLTGGDFAPRRFGHDLFELSRQQRSPAPNGSHWFFSPLP